MTGGKLFWESGGWLYGGDGYKFDQAVWGLARFLEAGATDVVEEGK